MSQYDAAKDLARQNLSRLIAACYYEPGAEFAEENVFDSMLDAARQLYPEFAGYAKHLGESFAADGPEKLLLDYARLFLGPNAILAKPYGSIWLEGNNTVMGESTMAVQELYREGGFEISEDFREVPDHIAVELEFLYLLIYRESEARRDGRPDAAQAMVDLRRRFVDRHLGAWVKPFAAAVKAGAQCRFYRELAGLTESFVGMEAARLRGN